MTTSLPKGVHFKHGSYYLVKRGKWLRLGRDRDEALALSEKIHDERWYSTDPEHDLAAYLAKAWSRASRNAQGRRKRKFELPLIDALALGFSQNWRCAVTSTPFTLYREPVSNRSPLAPSIDRIDNTKGYETGNVRLVCVAANYAMNQWGEEPLRVMLAHMKAHGS